MPMGIPIMSTMLALCAAAVAGPGQHAPVPRSQAEAIIRSAGVKAGLCVHVGVSDGRLTAALAEAGPFLVHGLAPDAVALEKGRSHIRQRGIYGRASIEHGSFARLPYADNLVNLLVVDDLPGLLAKGLSLKDVVRVVCPGGVAYVGARSGTGLTAESLTATLTAAGVSGFNIVKRDGVWARIRKPRPAGMDVWTHKTYDASGNCVSHDTAIGPLARLRWIAGPVWPMGTGYQVSNGGIVAAGGRTFHVTLNETANLNTVPQQRNQSWFLTARDAYNGLALWSRPIERRMTRDGQEFADALIAVGDRVYTVIGKHPVALDAATGTTLTTYPREAPPGTKLLYHDGLLVLAGGSRLCAFDPRSGTVRWAHRIQARDLVIGEGRLYLATRGHKALAALDLNTGEERWRTDLSAVEGKKKQLLFCQGGILVFVWERDWQTGHNGIAAFSTKDGKRLWDLEYTSTRATWCHRVWFVDGLVWHRTGKAGMAGVDPLTGTVKRQFVIRGGYCGGCCRDIATERYLVSTRPLNFFDWADGTLHGFRAGRHGCRAGVIVANGLLYSQPHGCKCVREALHGFVAFAPATTVDDRARAPAGLVRPGTADHAAGGRGEPRPAVTHHDDWPTYRHDAKRTGITAATVPADLKVLWQVEVDDQRRPTGPLAQEWLAGWSVGDRLTAPVVADGTVFVGIVDAHRVVALDAATGEKRWAYTAGGRLDTPPTIYRGLCLFGSADGWVTCLRAKDGALVWRLRAAPAERRIPAFGQLESPWPVVGGVLVENDLAYFVVGRTSALEGGLIGYAVEPQTGRTVWRRRLEGALSDLLVSDGATFRIAGGASAGISFDLKTGKRTASIRSGFRWTFAGKIKTFWGGPNRVLDRSWRALSVNETASHWMRIKQGYGPHEGQLVIGDPDRRRYFGFRFKSVHWSKVKDVSTEFGGHLLAWQGTDTRWSVDVPPTFQPESLIVAGEVLFVAGPNDRFRRTPGGQLWVLSAKDGAILKQYALPKPPVAEGLAAADDRLYVAARDGTLLCYGKK